MPRVSFNTQHVIPQIIDKLPIAMNGNLLSKLPNHSDIHGAKAAPTFAVVAHNAKYLVLKMQKCLVHFKSLLIILTYWYVRTNE